MAQHAIELGDVVEVLKGYRDNSFDAVLCDPPYGLSFMGKRWDYDVPGAELWREVLRVCKPGAPLVAFSGTRTYHRAVVQIEDAGFEIRDCLAWMTGQGFPKSMNIGCKCGRVSSPKRAVRSVPEANVSAAFDAADERREVLLSSVQEQGAQEHGTARAESEASHGAQPGLEGRGHVQAEQGELHRAEVCPVPGGVPTDGSQGRVRDGAQARDGGVSGSAADTRGSRASSGPRHAEQRSVEPGALPEQRGAQESRSIGTRCQTCGGIVGWETYGTALKPAFEPAVLARKPLEGTVAENVARWGVGALAIDASRIEGAPRNPGFTGTKGLASDGLFKGADNSKLIGYESPTGRWPANCLLDEEAGALLDAQSGDRPGMSGGGKHKAGAVPGMFGAIDGNDSHCRGDSGGASRFFYCAKAARKERNSGAVKNEHPTVKPIALMQYLARLLLPPTPGAILVPFAGSGSEMIGCVKAGWPAVLGIERESEYVEIARKRLEAA